MKKAAIFIILTFFSLSVFSQVSEGRSGVKVLNISKKGTDIRKIDDAQRAAKDTEPPRLTLLSPVLKKDSTIRTETRILQIKGKAEDAGGIFEILINGVEAKVGSDGLFYADIPVAFGKNAVTISATDVAFNKSMIKFFSDRKTSDITENVTAKVESKPVNQYSINLVTPSLDTYVTAGDQIVLRACIKATAPVKKIMISRNGTFINAFLGNSIVPDKECAFAINEPVALKLGINDLKIELFAADDTISRNITVEYSLYAARNFAILIGNEKYNDPSISELEEPVRDVAQFYEVLTKQYNFDPANVTMLRNCTKAEIIGKLHELRSVITPTDNLLIFYAGHGYWDEGMGVGYWLPKDASKSNPVNWIPNTDLTNYLGAIKTKHTLLIADACFSGGIFKTRSAFSASYAVEMLYQLNSRKAITSGTLTEVPDKSVFFQYLLKNLKENTNDYLSSEELFSKMRMAVINNSENVPQFGTIQNVGDEGGDFIFIKRRNH